MSGKTTSIYIEWIKTDISYIYIEWLTKDFWYYSNGWQSNAEITCIYLKWPTDEYKITSYV